MSSKKKERQAQQIREWKKTHPDRVKAIRNKSWAIHGAEMQRKWRENNKERRKEQRKRQLQRHREEMNEYYRLHKIKHPEILYAQHIAESYPLAHACELCPEEDVRTEGLQRHHPDYTYPEIFITVCPSCHKFAEQRLEERIVYYETTGQKPPDKMEHLPDFYSR